MTLFGVLSVLRQHAIALPAVRTYSSGRILAYPYVLEMAACFPKYFCVLHQTFTRFSCLEARYVCRQAAVMAAKILPLVGLAQDPINRGHGAQYIYRPPPAGARHCIC